MIDYSGATKRIRVSCAYLFRILVRDKYLLVRDEQGRNSFQPVGGVYKYHKDFDVKERFAGIPCHRFRYTQDLDLDLRLMIDRSKCRRFLRWYRSQRDRENINDLSREFCEELICRNVFRDPAKFSSIRYRFLGRDVQSSRYGDTIQIHFADIVELIPTDDQLQELIALYENPPASVRFATADEIHNQGIVAGAENQTPTISSHSYKILVEYEKNLKQKPRKRMVYQANTIAEQQACNAVELVQSIKDGDPTKDFFIISYQSANLVSVLKDCNYYQNKALNILIDKNRVTANWKPDILDQFGSNNCRGVITYVDRNYLNNSSACLQEAKMIVDNNLKHIIILLDMTKQDVVNTIDFWIKADDADKTRLNIFKQFFDYNDNTAHIDNSCLDYDYSSAQHLSRAELTRFLEINNG